MFDSFSSGILLAEQSGLSGYVILVLLIAAIVLGFFLAHLIANSMNVTDYRKRLAWVFIPVLVAALMVATGWPPKFGVDLRGGINMVGSLNLAAIEKDNDDPNYVPPTAKDIIPVLIRRVNPSGTKEIMIRALGEDKIEVTIPSVSLEEANGIWDSIVKTGKLEFRIVANGSFAEHAAVIAAAEAASRSDDFRVKRSKYVEDAAGNRIGVWVGIARILPSQEDIKAGNLPKNIPFKYSPRGGHVIRNKATGQIVPLSPDIYTDGEAMGLDFAVWCRDNNIQTPQILMLYPSDNQNVEGKHLASVSSQFDKFGRPAIGFRTNAEGMGRMGLLTKLNLEPEGQPQKELGIVLNDRLHSAPSISGVIRDQGEITGSFTQAEVNELKRNLDSGKLDVALNKNPISTDFVESTLGSELRSKGIWAIGISLLIVLAFMIFYYGFAGVVATISLVLNLFLIMALIMAIQQPLTLTGLAGLVLTVGMSVDANVLIFERIREELDRGAALRMAIRNGFDKATVTILDANITTLFTAIALYAIGTEQIKGFAVTLILGILMSMYTAIYCSRLMFDIAERRGFLKKLSMKRIMEKANWDFLSKISMTGVVSAISIAVGLFCMFTLGAKILDHDLRGGSTVRMVFREPQKIEDLRSQLNAHDMIVKDEKVEFTVSGFSGPGVDAEEVNRVFKVDSNLPAWEGGPEEEKWDQLDEVMTKVFGDKLEMHSATVKNAGQQSSMTPRRSDSKIAAFSDNHPARDSTSGTRMHFGQHRLEFPSIGSATQAALNMMNPSLMLQDDGESAAEANDGDSAETDSADSESATESGEDTPAADPESPANADTPMDPDAAALADRSPLTLDSIQDADDSNTNSSILSDKVVRKIEIKQPVSGKTLKELILQAGVALDREVGEEQLDVISPDTEPGESPDTTLSTNWTVEMRSIAQEDADDILAKWSSDFNSQPYFPMASKVGGQIAKSMQYQAFIATIAGLLAIIGYIWIRFQNLAFGLAAVIALIHDVAFVLGVIAITHYVGGALGFLGVTNFKISLEVVAAILTVIGYSLNDTIVVFDRIREVRGKRKEITAEIINTSISQTLSRTLLTSLTTFIVVFILYCFGGDAIHSFAFTLVIGIIVGTYSSIFIASPALLWLMNTVGLNPMEIDAAAE